MLGNRLMAHQTATVGSNACLPAIQSANFFSAAEWIAKESHFPGPFARKTSPKRPQFRGSFRPIRRLSRRFLRAMIVAWLFPMHVDKMPSLLQRTALAFADTSQISTPLRPLVFLQCNVDRQS
jgi:hypothetical protein